MSSAPRKTPGLSTAGALLTLLVSLWLAPTSNAGCLHPALRIGTEPAGAAHFEWLIATGAMTAPADQAIESEPLAAPSRPAPLPCNGPSCSNRDELPTPSSATISILVDSWAWFRLNAPAPTSGARLRRNPADRPSPRRLSPAIFHPPRPEAA